MSTAKPAIIAIKALIARILPITTGFTASDIRIGSISSEVDRNTAISVPMVITLPAYILDAVTENPHWGKIPRTDPHSGPTLPAFFKAALDLSPSLSSIYSIKRYVTNRNGRSLRLSIIASRIASNIISSFWGNRISYRYYISSLYLNCLLPSA